MIGLVVGIKDATSGGSIVKQQQALFDELGRLMRQIGAASQTTSFAYDRTDLLTSVTDPRSNLYSYAYDALQRLIRTTDQVSAQVNLTRDGQDNITAYSDPRSLVTTYVRNGFGEVIQEQGPDVGTAVIVRDARGLATQVTDPRGIVINMTYDNAGRLLTESYPSATTQNVTYTYDAIAGGNKGKGRLTGMTDGSGSTARVYDALGRISTETRVIAGKSYVTSYGYNAADRLTTITYPSGRIVTYARNSLGKVTSVTTQKNGTAAIDTVVSGIGWKPMANLITGMTYGNGLVMGASYDNDYRLTTMTLMNGATPVISLGYGYADALNLTAVNDNVTSANSVSLWYDQARRLQNANGPWGAATYYYTSVGDRSYEITTPSGGATTTKIQNYPATSNRIANVTTNGTLTRSFTHDAAGNITVDVKGGDTFTTTYNVRNRPVTVVRTGTASQTSTYAYNALEQMVTRVTTAPGGPAGTVHYIYDTQGHLIAEADGATGATTREYIWLASNDNQPVDLPLALVTGVNTASPVLSMVHADHLGRPIRMTDASRATVWQAFYSPWGEPYSLSGTIENNLRFPGQFFLIETGLSYNWHRHYDPTTGRYTQPDPLRFVDGPSVYAYVGGSPYMWTDREGKFGIMGGLLGAGLNFGTQLALNLAANGGNLRSALRCIDIADVAISGVLGGFGLGVVGNTFRGKFSSAAVSAGIGGYLKNLYPPIPVRVGDDCECKTRSGFNAALNAIAH